MSTDLINHIESHVGRIARGWSELKDGTTLPFKLLEISGSPVKDAVTFTTLGLNKTLLVWPDRKTTRMELAFSCYDRFQFWDIGGLLATVAQDLLSGAQKNAL